MYRHCNATSTCTENTCWKRRHQEFLIKNIDLDTFSEYQIVCWEGKKMWKLKSPSSQMVWIGAPLCWRSSQNAHPSVVPTDLAGGSHWRNRFVEGSQELKDAGVRLQASRPGMRSHFAWFVRVVCSNSWHVRVLGKTQERRMSLHTQCSRMVVSFEKSSIRNSIYFE